MLLATYDGALPNVGMDLRGLQDEYLGARDGGWRSQLHSLPRWPRTTCCRVVHCIPPCAPPGDMDGVLALLQSAGFEVVASERPAESD